MCLCLLASASFATNRMGFGVILGLNLLSFAGSVCCGYIDLSTLVLHGRGCSTCSYQFRHLDLQDKQCCWLPLEWNQP
jgi:hypothetical protein